MSSLSFLRGALGAACLATAATAHSADWTGKIACNEAKSTARHDVVGEAFSGPITMHIVGDAVTLDRVWSRGVARATGKNVSGQAMLEGFGWRNGQSEAAFSAKVTMIQEGTGWTGSVRYTAINGKWYQDCTVNLMQPPVAEPAAVNRADESSKPRSVAALEESQSTGKTSLPPVAQKPAGGKELPRPKLDQAPSSRPFEPIVHKSDPTSPPDSGISPERPQPNAPLIALEPRESANPSPSHESSAISPPSSAGGSLIGNVAAVAPASTPEPTADSRPIDTPAAVPKAEAPVIVAAATPAPSSFAADLGLKSAPATPLGPKPTASSASSSATSISSDYHDLFYFAAGAGGLVLAWMIYVYRRQRAPYRASEESASPWMHGPTSRTSGAVDASSEPMDRPSLVPPVPAAPTPQLVDAAPNWQVSQAQAARASLERDAVQAAPTPASALSPGVAIPRHRWVQLMISCVAVGLIVHGAWRWFTGHAGIDSSSAGAIADQIIQQKLNAPGSYRVVRQEVLWDRTIGDETAVIVRTEYDAQNGFGALLRGCHYTSFVDLGTKFSFNPLTGLQPCADNRLSPSWDTEKAQLVDILIRNAGLERFKPETRANAPKAQAQSLLGSWKCENVDLILNYSGSLRRTTPPVLGNLTPFKVIFNDDKTFVQNYETSNSRGTWNEQTFTADDAPETIRTSTVLWKDNSPFLCPSWKRIPTGRRSDFLWFLIMPTSIRIYFMRRVWHYSQKSPRCSRRRQRPMYPGQLWLARLASRLATTPGCLANDDNKLVLSCVTQNRS